MSDGSGLEEGELASEQAENQSPRAGDKRRPARVEPRGNKEHKRKVKKVQENKGTQQDYFDVYGPGAHASVEFLQRSQAIKPQDVSNLINWAIGSGASPSWAFIKNKPLISKAVLLFVSGIDEELWKQAGAELAAANILGPPVVVNAARAVNSLSASPAQAARSLMSVPFTKASQKRAKEYARIRGPPLPATHYTLSATEMEALGYPLPKVLDYGTIIIPEGYIASSPGDGSMDGKLVAMDCEMCRTADGLELTRVSLVGEDEQVLLDELVMPSNPITDYVTKFSGITAEMLEGVTTTVEDVQEKVLRFVHDKTLLVGHGLENDLKALRMLHAHCLDTAILYPHPKGPPFRSALRFLAGKFLKKTIQADQHNSIEDAVAAMRLAKLKIKHGPNWGSADFDPTKMEMLVEVLEREGRGCALVDSPSGLERLLAGGAHAIVANSGDESADKIQEQVKRGGVQFVWGHWPDVSNFQAKRAANRRRLSSKGIVVDPAAAACGDTADAGDTEAACTAGPQADAGSGAGRGDCEDAGEGGDAPTSTAGGKRTLGEVLKAVDRRLEGLWEALPCNTLLVVATGHGDIAEVKRAKETKYRRDQEEPLDGLPCWRPPDEEKLVKLCKQATRALCFAAVRQ